MAGRTVLTLCSDWLVWMRAALDSCCFGARAWPSMCHCRRVRREAGRRRESGCGGVDGACVVAPDPVRRARGRRTTETARRGGADGHWCAPPPSVVGMLSNRCTVKPVVSRRLCTQGRHRGTQYIAWMRKSG
ncbi:hypothetical protein BU14_0869s0005 [Porphyra umbilicalis]|uniref:Ig-like domain-containing protein n=1 Tax=Porphyra umbilicalis TaxID=2786 RepID=A0A1X6NNX3_PORUM|nr:hypothetical protein BU14_0869s0005 [Porphyra umbilicalis]|eukprot:OSX70186.1 hypothetical protein BU14_0869s0005 [Porphyra umbilicalis]